MQTWSSSQRRAPRSVKDIAFRRFSFLIDDLDDSQFNDLLSCGQSQPLVYIYDPPTRSSWRPEIGDVPWFLEFLLTQFSKKHVFEWKRNNCRILERTIHAMEQWRRKRQWEFALHDNSNTHDAFSYREVGRLKSKTRLTRPCSVPCPSWFNQYLDDSMSIVWKRVCMQFMPQSQR